MPSTVPRNVILCLSLLALGLASAAEARVRVVRTKAGPALRAGKTTLPFSAIRGEARLGPYSVKRLDSGNIETTRSWKFKATEAKSKREFNGKGRLVHFDLSSGKLSATKGSTSTLRGMDQKRGRYTWKLWTWQNPFVIHAWGKNEKGDLAWHRSTTGPKTSWKKDVYHDGRVDEVRKPVPRLNLPSR